jgi:putative ABC transport system permease protein
VTVAHARASGRRRRRPTGLGAGAGLALRRLRSEPGAAVTILALVGVTCFLFAASPRLFNRFADRGLRYAVAHAPLPARNASEVEYARIPADGGPDPLAVVAARADRAQQALPAALREPIATRTYVVRSSRYAETIGAVPGLARFLTLRQQSDIREHIRLVAGHLPRVSSVRVLAVDSRIPQLPQAKEVQLVQVALSTTAARELHLHVGDRLELGPDSTDVAVQRVPIHDEQPLAVEVSGLFVVRDPQAPFWFGDGTLDRPFVQVSPDGDMTLVYGQALIAPQQYATMVEATRPLPLAYEYRYFLDPRRLDAGRLQGLSDAVARLNARYAGAGPLERRVDIRLEPVLDRYRGARSQAETLLAIAAIGLLACALANLGLLGALSYDRRRTETGILRTRGASPLDLLLAQVSEGALLAAPAGLLGWAGAVLAIHARGSGLSAWLALAIVIPTICLLVAAIAGVARRPLRPLGRDDVVLARPSPRRLALEGLVAVAAAAGVYLLRRRGLETSNSSGFDPYLAAVPVLLGLACGIVALRLYPLPLGAAARLARRGRGLALPLGLSRAARQSDVALLPLLVLVLALAVGSFSGVMLHTLEAGQARTGWRAVGADLRVDAPADESLPPRLDARLGKIGDVAPAYVQDAGLATVGEASLVVALDLPAYQRLVAGTPADVRLPPALSEAPPIPSVVPALVSTDWPGGGSFQVAFPGEALNFISVAERAAFPGVPRGTPFAVVALAALRRAGETVAPNRLYLRHAGAAAVRQAVRDAAPGAEIASRAAVLRNLRASPLVESVRDGFRGAIALAAFYAAVAVALMTLIAARSRSRDLALVRTMGGSQREALVLAAVELAPFVVAALLLGVGLGLAIPYLIAPGLDLAFATRNSSNPIAISWLPPAAFATGLVVLVGAAVLLVGARTRRANLDRALRIGER